MSPELKAAVERLRRYKQSRVEVIPEYRGSAGADRRQLDRFLVVDACLAEHPEDDDEPATEEWLLTLDGCVREDDEIKLHYRKLSYKHGSLYVEWTRYKDNPTRRDVRLMREVLQ